MSEAKINAHMQTPFRYLSSAKQTSSFLFFEHDMKREQVGSRCEPVGPVGTRRERLSNPVRGEILIERQPHPSTPFGGAELKLTETR